jgi:hypothetical protein
VLRVALLGEPPKRTANRVIVDAIVGHVDRPGESALMGFVANHLDPNSVYPADLPVDTFLDERPMHNALHVRTASRSRSVVFASRRGSITRK